MPHPEARPPRSTLALAVLGAFALVLSLAATVPAANAAPASAGAAPINGLAQTPYQGWNTYYGLGSSFDDQTIRAEADALVDRGLKAAGYDYVWIDGGWWDGSRAADGTITPSATQWPHGMKAVADYVHSKGLKIGIYTDAGKDGCGGARQGSYGHYQQDADTFAAWGYDALKVDFCGGENMGLDPATQYGQFRDALLNNASHRPILFNICNPFVPETGAPAGKSAYDSYNFGPTTGNSWRTDTDIGFVRNVQYRDFLRNMDHDAAHPEAAGPGHWNDPDYLAPELGFTAAEARSQFSMWSVLAAPLIVGSDVRSLSQQSIDMLTNREVLAIDQDRLGKQGTLVSQDGDGQVWSKPLADGSRAVALFNRGETARAVQTTAKAVGLGSAGAYSVRDVWNHSTTESASMISAAVPAHSVVLYRVTPGADPSVVAPEVTLSPVSTPAAYPGSQLRLAVPGKPLAVDSFLQNDGRTPIKSASVTLSVPAGWQVQPSPSVALGTVTGGRRVPLHWTVTPPPDAQPGVVELKQSAAYTWGDTPRPASASSAASVQVPPKAPSGETDLAHHEWLRATSGWMTPNVDGSVGGGPLRMEGTTYPTGIGVASPSTIEYYVGGQCSTVTATVGIDDSADFDSSGGTATFQILGDGQQAADSGAVDRSAPGTRTVSASVGSADVLTLQVGDAGDGGYNDRADWADLKIQCQG